MSKRILSLVLTLALVLGSFSMAFADTATTTSKKMTDVEGTKYEKAVVTLGKLKVLEGYTDGTFKPGNTITRAEFAAVASRIRGLETAAQNSKGTTEFKDVPASHWASGYVNVASKNGLIKGMGNGQFAPESQITYEQAITMIVRALGYEYAAQSLGGYPVGYLSVASQEQLLKGINEGAQGTAASRGLVALLLDNALDIPKMIQVGYGDQARWVKSGTENTKELKLYEDLGLKQIEKAVVSKADSKKQTVTIGNLGLKADKDFDYVGLKGLRVTAWYDSKTDELIVAKEDGAYKAKYDVVEKTTKSNEIKLIGANEKYDIAKDSGLKASDYTADNNTYAKVIIDEYGEVRDITAYNLTDKLVVKEVSKDLIKGYDRKEISESNDYTIIKNGKEISAADLNNKDFLIYNSKSEVAVVITDIREGKLDTVYKSGFKFESKTYDNSTTKYGDVEYIVENDLEAVNQDVLEEMQKNGEVKVYFSFDGKPLFIDGKAEEVASNYVMVESSTSIFNDRGTAKYTFDVLNSEGKVVKYEVKKADIEDAKKIVEGVDGISSKNTATVNENAWKAAVKSKNVFKVTTDADNKITKIENVESGSANGTEVDDTYLLGARLQSNTVVFMANGETDVEDYEVIKWVDAEKEFKKILTGTAYKFDGKVVAIFADTTDGDEKTEPVVGVLKKAKETIKGSKYDLIVEVNGVEKAYTAKDFAASTKSEKASDLVGKENIVVVVDVTKGGSEVKGWSKPSNVVTGTVDRATSNGIELKSNSTKYIVEGKYYNNSLKSTIDAGDVVDKNVTLYLQPGSDRYVQVVRLGEGTAEVKAGTVTYINVAENLIEVDNKVLELDTRVRLLDANGNTVAIGKNEVVKALKKDDVLATITQDKGVATELKLAKNVTPDPKPADKTALNAAIATAKTKVNDTEYTQTSRDALQATITAAENLSANATQVQVDAATKAITDAIAGLVKETTTPGKVTAEATIDTFLGAQIVQITLSDATKVADAKEVKLNGTTIVTLGASNFKDGGIRVSSKDKVTTAQVVLKDGTTIDVTLK